MGSKRYVCPRLNESVHNSVDPNRGAPIYLTHHKRTSLVGPERKWVETKRSRGFLRARYPRRQTTTTDDDAAPLVPCRKAFEGRLGRPWRGWRHGSGDLHRAGGARRPVAESRAGSRGAARDSVGCAASAAAVLCGVSGARFFLLWCGRPACFFSSFFICPGKEQKQAGRPHHREDRLVRSAARALSAGPRRRGHLARPAPAAASEDGGRGDLGAGRVSRLPRRCGDDRATPAAVAGAGAAVAARGRAGWRGRPAAAAP